MVVLNKTNSDEIADQAQAAAKELRQRLFLSRKKMAELLEVPAERIRNFESGTAVCRPTLLSATTALKMVRIAEGKGWQDLVKPLRLAYRLDYLEK